MEAPLSMPLSLLSRSSSLHSKVCAAAMAVGSCEPAGCGMWTATWRHLIASRDVQKQSTTEPESCSSADMAQQTATVVWTYSTGFCSTFVCFIIWYSCNVSRRPMRQGCRGHDASNAWLRSSRPHLSVLLEGRRPPKSAWMPLSLPLTRPRRGRAP